jgi:PLP dependent protein
MDQENLADSIKERYESVISRIAEARSKNDRTSQPVRLVVVSKSQSLEVVRAAIAAGITVFGENYVEEAVEKIAALKETGVEWHMIGHVQSRKAEPVAANFSMVQSVDNLRLAQRLDRFCAEMERTLPVLLEFNVSGEASKFGFPAWDERNWDKLIPLLEPLLALPHLKVSGLMTMPPYFSDTEETRPYFIKLRTLQSFLQNHFHHIQWSELSMGTSVDYQVAVQEGATFVRVGEAILGPRPKKRES